MILLRRSNGLAAAVSVKLGSRKLQKNPRRKFYTCPAAQGCKFFKWCDEVTDEDIKFRPAFIIPICPCGAGPCRRVITDSGQAYLICCIKKGFGACGFFQREDIKMLPRCDAMDDVDFWMEADQILRHVESAYQILRHVESASRLQVCREMQTKLYRRKIVKLLLKQRMIL